MKFSAKFPGLCAILFSALLAGCSQSSNGLGIKSAASMLVPSSLKSDAVSTRGKRYRASERERNCLARAMFFESNRSSRDGLVAVGSVVMNRRDSGKWGNDVCSVVGAKRQFAPGVMSRQMNSKALPDVMAAADSVLSGERHPKVHQNVMFFHTAGLRFPYKNMKYTVVAGGNHFYEKVSRRRKKDALPAVEQPAAPEVMVASAEPQAMPGVSATALTGTTPAATAAPAPMMVASAASFAPRKSSSLSSNRDSSLPMSARAPKRQPTPQMMASAAAFPSTPAAPAEERFGANLPAEAPVPASVRTAAPASMQAAEIEGDFDTGQQPVMALEASPEQATGIGELIMQQQELGQ